MKKMIIRADDVGFTPVNDIGAFEAIENGVVTAADVMMDCSGTVGALERLKDMPWISVGWHTHMWGSPVMKVNPQTSTLIEKEGEFAGRFRTDLQKAEDVDFNEILDELRTQIERCVSILGRAPSTGGSSKRKGNGISTYGRAFNQVCEEYAIALDIAAREPQAQLVSDEINAAREAGEEWAQFYGSKPLPPEVPAEKWADRKIIIADAAVAYRFLNSDSVADWEKNYDPVRYYTEDQGNLMRYGDDVIIEQSWHPGYVDYFTFKLGERYPRPRARHFTLCRAQDAYAMQSPILKNWIIENKIELMNYRDALYGTREYQNHLRNIGSDLCVL